jgi:ribosome biogenesis GTPase
MRILYDTTSGAGDSARVETADPLRDMGWDDRFAEKLAGIEARPGRAVRLEPARVLEVRRGSFLVAARGESGGLVELEAKPSGRLSGDCATEAEWPTTGDWVALRARSGGSADETVLVEAVLPRRSSFSRKAAGDARYDKVAEQVVAANIDTAFIVAAAGNDFSVRRIERYAALALESGAAPVLVVTKADLAGDGILDLVEAAGGACPFAPAFAVCAPEGKGLEAISRFLTPGSTSVLLGSSGSGKSTLLNALAGVELNATGEVRAFDQRGRHTTTARTLFALSNGAMVIDTPGLREVQLWLGEEDAGGIFTEIEAAAASCRFKDCSHEAEPGCAVKAGLADGSISMERYDSWLKLRREARFLETKTNPLARKAEKDKWKSISKAVRNRDRRKG